MLIRSVRCLLASGEGPVIIMRTALRELREQRFISQAVLAERARLTVYTVSRLENGRHRPTLQTVRKLAGALGVKPEDIWFATPQRKAGAGAQGEPGA